MSEKINPSHNRKHVEFLIFGVIDNVLLSLILVGILMLQTRRILDQVILVDWLKNKQSHQ